MIITLLEKEGKLSESEGLFNDRVALFAEEIEVVYADQPEYLQHLKVLIQRHLKAFSVFMSFPESRPVEASMKILYDYESMRQKRHFKRAL